MASPPTSKARRALLARLEPYWRLEAGNVVFVPLIVLVATRGQVGLITLAALAPVIVLLVIGAAYWRGKVLQLKGQRPDLAPLMKRIAAWKRPSQILTLVAIAAASAGWLKPDWSVGMADRIAATACAVLAVLEYVNYYHRQLQHFDSWADFKRLLAGKGFRKSWMARDMEAVGD
jgi:hypothetical protein